MKPFETPVVEVVVFETDVITTSLTTCGEDCPLKTNCGNDTAIG